jgi:shikimate 5-dehydrogenase
MANVPLVPPIARTFYFIGVTTGQSSSRLAFPLWMQALGHPDVQLEGIDLKIHDEKESYRQVVAHIKREPLAMGALVTTHKT